MGFFGALGKILEGKPIYGDGDASGGEQKSPKTGKIIPVVRVTRVESPIRGNRLEVNIIVRNESKVPVCISRVHLLGVDREIDDDLAPGAAQEYPIYAGQVLHDDSHRDAEIQYRTEDGDYFAARYDVRYHTEKDGLHIGELQLLLPIRDI
jgi:hypothetical protein